MTVANYLGLRAQARQQTDTRKHELVQALLDGEETTRGAGGLLDLESLANQPARDSFKTAFEARIDGAVQNTYGIAPGVLANPFYRNDQWDALLGIGFTDMHQLIEGAKDKYSFDGAMEALKKPFEEKMKKVRETAITGFGAADGPDVMTYLGGFGENAGITPHIDVTKLDNPYLMMELVELQLQHGAVPPNSIRERPYFV
ncbi:hypothetical protein KY320_03450 [Candidatus Woesearchaeota archaeon]|nr:hypothetical protein [Candidatus Woesearchaeota archaeon]